jgi:uncharacterized protein (TIGR02099 family)
MKRLYHFSVRTLRRSLILLIVLTGILIIAGRLLIPLAAEYRTDVADWASELLGQPVEIGRLKGDWRGLGPELVLYDLQLINRKTQKATLYLKEVRVSFGLIDSLRQLSPVVRKVSFVSPRLRVVRQKSGAITVGNLDEMEQTDSSSAFLLPTHLNLINGEIIWEDLTSTAPPLRLTDVDLYMRNGGTRHQLNGSVSLPGKQQGKIDLSIDLKGQLDRIETWTARSFMQSRGIDLAFLLNRRIAQSYRFSNEQADITLWGEWNHQGLASLEGTTEWDKVIITRQSPETGESSGNLELDRVAGAVRIQRLDTGWKMDLADLKIQRKGTDWPKAQMGVVAKKDLSGNWQVSAGSSHFRLEDIQAISTLFPGIDTGIEQTLSNIQAQGSLNNLRLKYHQQPEGTNWEASGDVSAFHSKPWKDIPGISNLPLSFWMGPDQGTLALNAQDVTLEFADLFRDPLILKRVMGDLTWKSDTDTVTLNTDQLFAANDDIHTVTRMRMDIPRSEQEPLFLDLQSDYWDGDAITTHRYLPAGIMGENVVAWLDRSIGEGHVTEGSVVVRGPLQDFPFNKTHSGRFEVFFNVENLKLDYWPEWPALTNLNADVRFLNNSFDTWAIDGSILDSRLESAHATIADLALTSPLKLTGLVKGPFNDNLRLLTESPLKTDFAQLIKGLKGEGDAQLGLSFSLPIDDGSPFKLDGKLSFLNSTLTLADWKLALNKIQGDLQFDQDHIFASGIKGEALGLPITVDVATPKHNAKATRISAQATISSKNLQAQLPTQNVQDHLSGQSLWKMDLDIPHISAGPDAPVPLSITSDLIGSQINFPEPLGKSADQAWPFQLKTRIDGRDVQRLDIRYNEQIRLALALNRKGNTPRLTHAGIQLGGAEATLPKREGIEVKGKLDRLALDEWLSISDRTASASTLPPLNRVAVEIGQLQIEDQQSGATRFLLERGETHWEGTTIGDWAEGGLLYPLNPATTPELRVKLKRVQLDPWLALFSAREPDGKSNANFSIPSEISVVADKLTLKEATVSDFAFKLKHRQDRWQGDIRSNRFEGTLMIPAKSQEEPIQLNLNRLSLTLDDTLLDQKKTTVSTKRKALDPTKVSAIQANVKEVVINDKPFGSLQIITQRRATGLELQIATLNSDRIVIAATGSWLVDSAQQSSSRIDLSLSSKELGSVLTDLNLTDNLKEAPVEIDSRLNWQGSPLDFSTQGLNGQVSMQIGSGQFLKVDPGVGRLFGLFNLGALKRRLTLDFSDIFQKGFAFDAITGTFLLDTGDAYTNDFQMKGPSANIELSGRIGLGDEDFDSLVTITPKISSSIPIAGAIAGGPAVGAALFIAQQLMGDAFDKVTQLQYMATGSWDNPILTPKTREPAEGDKQRDETVSSRPEQPEQEIDPTLDLEPAEELATESTTTDEPDNENPAPDKEKKNKVSRFFSKLLNKIKPTGPTYEQVPKDIQ